MLLQSSQERIHVLAHPASGATDLLGLLQPCSDLYDEASWFPVILPVVNFFLLPSNQRMELHSGSTLIMQESLPILKSLP